MKDGEIAKTAAEHLTQKTHALGFKWHVDGAALKCDTEVNANSWQNGQAQFAELISSMGIEFTPEILARFDGAGGAGSGRVRIFAKFRQPHEIQRMALNQFDHPHVTMKQVEKIGVVLCNLTQDKWTSTASDLRISLHSHVESDASGWREAERAYLQKIHALLGEEFNPNIEGSTRGSVHVKVNFSNPSELAALYQKLVYSEEMQMAFLMGTHLRLGAVSSVRTFATAHTFDRNLLKTLFEFLPNTPSKKSKEAKEDRSEARHLDSQSCAHQPKVRQEDLAGGSTSPQAIQGEQKDVDSPLNDHQAIQEAMGTTISKVKVYKHEKKGTGKQELLIRCSEQFQQARGADKSVVHNAIRSFIIETSRSRSSGIQLGSIRLFKPNEFDKTTALEHFLEEVSKKGFEAKKLIGEAMDVVWDQKYSPEKYLEEIVKQLQEQENVTQNLVNEFPQSQQAKEPSQARESDCSLM